MAQQRQEEAPEVFTVRKAVRHRTPQIVCIFGPSFSGKTFGALMVAAGLAEPGAKIGVIDTENGRFSTYADDPDVMRVLPQGFHVIELHPPFHPKRYIAASRQLENEGCALIITDSGSHAWEGEGGAQDIKEKDKAWNNAKLWTKRYKASLQYSSCHHIVCLRAQEKTKIVGTGRDQQYIPLGIMPICEKSFTYDLGVSFEVEGEIDGKPATHLARPKKWPKAMNGLFNNWQPQLLTPEVGKRIREWNDGGQALDPTERLRMKARAMAEQGTAVYSEFFNGLKKNLQDYLVKTVHEENRYVAEQADLAHESEESDAREPELVI